MGRRTSAARCTEGSIVERCQILLHVVALSAACWLAEWTIAVNVPHFRASRDHCEKPSEDQALHAIDLGVVRHVCDSIASCTWAPANQASVGLSLPGECNPIYAIGRSPTFAPLSSHYSCTHGIELVSNFAWDADMGVRFFFGRAWCLDWSAGDRR
jgi:hypothetical protein